MHQLSRPIVRLAVALAALGVATSAARAANPQTAGAAGAANRELIVLVLIDALRADAVGAYGYERPTTPVLDQLAAEGTRYTRAYVNAPWTRPSTASFLTGLHASRHRTQTGSSKLPADVTTVAQRLRAKGWKSSGFVANGNGGSLAGLDRGFDKFEDPTNTYTKATRGLTYNGLPRGEFIVERVLAHLGKSQADKEFVFVFLVDPHDPYGAPPELEKLFLAPDFKGTIRRKTLWERDNDYPADERHSVRAIYDAGIRYADHALGQLVEGLKRQGRWNDTTLFVTADHGEGFGEHGFYLHGHHFWDEVVRVPLVARGPKFAREVSDRPTQAIDVARTIVELAGADATELPGTSLVGARPAKPRVISEYNEFGIRRQAITDGRYKVIWQRPALREVYARDVGPPTYFPSVSFDGETVHAFDLVADPGERKNLGESLPVEAAGLLDELRAFVLEGEKLAARAPRVRAP